MAVSIHGNNGVVTTNGTAAAPSFAAPDTDTGLYFGTNLIHATTNGVNRFNIDATGKVGIGGATSPEELLDLGNALQINLKVGGRAYLGQGYSTAATILGHSVKAKTTGTVSGGMEVTETNSGGGAPAAMRMQSGTIEFHTATSGTSGATFDSEKLRIDSTGRILVNRQSQHASSAERLSVNGMTSIQFNSTSSAGLYIYNEDTTGSGAIQPHIFCHDGSGIRTGLGIQRSTGLTIFNGQFGISFRTGASSVGGTERLNIQSDGKSNFTNDVRIVKTGGALLEVTTNTGAADAILRLSEGATGSTTNGGGMFYSGADNKLYITCGTNSTTKRVTINRDDGHVGINTTAPDAMLQVDYDFANSKVGLRLRAASGSGTKTWQLSEINGTPAVLTIRNATNGYNILNIDGANQRVGINKTDPDGKGIDVAHGRTNTYSGTQDHRGLAHIIARNTSDAPDRFASISIVSGGSTQAEGSINLVQTANYTGDLTFKLRYGATSWAERVRITSAGKVGINANNPNAKFQVEGASAYAVTSSGRVVEGIDVNATAGGSGNYGSGISFGAGATGRAAIVSVQEASDADNVGLAVITHPTGLSSADGVQKIRIKSTGFVGIGTDNPDTFLHVENGVDTSNTYIHVQNSHGGGGNAGVKIQNANGEWTLIANNVFRIIDDDNSQDALQIQPGATSSSNRCLRLFGSGGTGGSFATGSVAGDFEIKITNLQTVNGNNWRPAQLWVIWRGMNGNATSNNRSLTYVRIGGLSTWSWSAYDTIEGSDLSPAIDTSDDTTTSCNIDFTGPSDTGTVWVWCSCYNAAPTVEIIG